MVKVKLSWYKYVSEWHITPAILIDKFMNVTSFELVWLKLYLQIIFKK